MGDTSSDSAAAVVGASTTAAPVDDSSGCATSSGNTSGKVASLQAQLVEARHAVEDLRQRRDAMQAQIAELHERREAARAILGGLVGQPLAEIKRLARSPPDAVRRTLVATWVLLHCERYVGKSSVRFDEAREWPRVQRMLAEESFVTQVLNFSSERLHLVPSVHKYLSCLLSGTTADTPRTRSSATPRGNASSATARCPLTAEAVERASRPCGALFRWISMLLGELKEQQLPIDLQAVNADLKAAEQHSANLARSIVEVQAAALAQQAADAAAAVAEATALEMRQPFQLEVKDVQSTTSRPATAFEDLPKVDIVPFVFQYKELPIREVLRRQVHGEPKEVRQAPGRRLLQPLPQTRSPQERSSRGPTAWGSSAFGL